MKSITPANRTTTGLPLLINGERMSQPDFHRRYQAYPDDRRFELIGGVVFMASPQRRPHSRYQSVLGEVFSRYETATLGVESLINATVILSQDCEPQPDNALRLLPEFGGQSTEDESEYIVGCPELVAEIAHSTRDIDLHRKRQDYEGAGAKEYIVLALEEPQLHWFDFASGREIKPGRDGISRSRVFPGLWLAVAALQERQKTAVMKVVQLGLKSRAHQVFVKKLATRRK